MTDYEIFSTEAKHLSIDPNKLLPFSPFKLIQEDIQKNPWKVHILLNLTVKVLICCMVGAHNISDIFLYLPIVAS